MDIAPNLLAQARERAQADGVAHAQFDEGDAETLPYENASFDLVLSMFGAMFCPRPERTAAELVRVCRPGGRIVMANWVAGGFIGQMFKVTAAHVPPPAGLPPPLLWGDEGRVKDRFKEGIADLRFRRRTMTFAFPFPPQDVVECFRRYYGPTLKAFAALDGKAQAALRHDLETLRTRENQATDGTTRVSSEYLEVTTSRTTG